MKFLITAILLLVTISYLNAQIQIGNETVIAGETILTTNGSITDNRTSTQPLDIVSLKGSGTLKLAGEWIVNELKVDGNIMLEGNITITNSMLLLNGAIEPITNAQLLLDSEASATSENQAFVNGALYRKGQGELFFPIGKNGKYAPITFLEVSGENVAIYGMEAFDQELALESLPNEILQISDELYPPCKVHLSLS